MAQKITYDYPTHKSELDSIEYPCFMRHIPAPNDDYIVLMTSSDSGVVVASKRGAVKVGDSVQRHCTKDLVPFHGTLTITCGGKA